MMVWLCGAVLSFAVILGGGTHAGFIGDVFVQMLSIPLLMMALWRLLEPARRDFQKIRVIFIPILAAIVLVGIQVLPLPFDVWAGGASFFPNDSESPLILPSRNWATLSISPQATWAAAASLIVPAAIFSAAGQLEFKDRLILTWLMLFLGGAALVLGFLQVAQGPASGLRFYEVTNPSEAVGFFANRNHFAAHLYVALVLGSLWFLGETHKFMKTRALYGRSTLLVTAAGVFLVSVMAGLAMARSRAGDFLAIAALGGIILLVFTQRGKEEGHSRGRRFSGGRMSILTILFAAVFAAQFGLGSILSRFQGDPAEDLRVPLAKTTTEAAFKALPFGTGLGSFVPVYATVEKEKDAFPGYANRAHNDFVEFFLEAGVIGVLLMLGFAAWFFYRCYKFWLRAAFKNSDPLLLHQRAATLIILLLLLHSAVDYPLRTCAMSAIFAFFCAILALDARAPQEAPAKPVRKPQKNNAPSQGIPVIERWGPDKQWPEGWQRTSG